VLPRKKEPITMTNPEWPATLDEAVAKILDGMKDQDRALVRATPRDGLIRFHHGWGTGIRNTFGLWGGNRALLDACGGGHPDDASMVIIEAVWERLQGT
jgi:hypothetical protein